MQPNTLKTIQIEQIEYSVLVSDIKKIVLNALQDKQSETHTTDFITRKQVCELFNISLPTVHNWIKAGILKPYKIGNQTRFKYTDVLNAPKVPKLK